MPRNLFVASACVALTSAVALFAAQNAETPTKQTPQRREARKPITGDAQAAQSHLRSPDHMLASCVALGNQEEIALSDVGRQKGTNDEVKKFAEMLATDHHEFLVKLQKFAPEATQADYLNYTPKAANADDANSKVTGRKEVAETAAKDGAAATTAAVENGDAKNTEGAHHGFNHMALERELAAQCLSSAKEKLALKSGAEFDKCFIGMQLAMHMGMKNKLVVYQRHASSELAGILADGLKTTEEHLAKAEEIMKDMDSSSTTTTIEKTRDGAKKDRKVIKEKVSE